MPCSLYTSTNKIHGKNRPGPKTASGSGTVGFGAWREIPKIMLLPSPTRSPPHERKEKSRSKPMSMRRSCRKRAGASKHLPDLS